MIMEFNTCEISAPFNIPAYNKQHLIQTDIFIIFVPK